MAPEAENPQGNSTKILQAVLILSAALLAIYFFVQIIWQILIWIFVVLIVIILIMNRKALIWMYNELKKTYEKNKVLGIGAIVIAVMAAPVLILYLFGKSIMDFRRSEFGQSMMNRRRNNEEEDDEEVEDVSEDDFVVDIDHTEVEEDKPKKPKILPKQHPKKDKNMDDESQIF